MDIVESLHGTAKGDRSRRREPSRWHDTDDTAGLSGRALARELRVRSNRITDMVAGDRAVTTETAILLGERFGTSAEFWLNLQIAHDLDEARRHRHRAA
jgi:addiction module HigA family antidote